MSQIVIPMQNIKTEFEGLVYKYANAIETAGQDKAVRNVKSDRVDDTLDALLVNNNFDKRMKEVLSLMHDFGATIPGTAEASVVTVTFTPSARWAGTTTNLLSLVKAYILDGMMVDWLNVTSPNEAAVYITKLVQDEQNIKVELYTKGAPQ